MSTGSRRQAISADGRGEGWRRIRVGVTGLAAILVLIGFASAMLSRITDQAAVSAQSSVPAQQIQPREKPKDEPMAELGVVPGAPEAAVAAPTQRPR